MYSVCRVQKAFEIRAVLETLSIKGIKEIYIGTMICPFLKFMIPKNRVNSRCCGGVGVAVVRI